MPDGRENKLVSDVYNEYMVAMASSVITARLDPETLALVDRLSKAQGRTRSWFAARAIKQAAEAEAEFQAFVQEGIDAADRGELVPHEEV
ncbi:MAG: ribbon-helix-helix protein, CopG family, partial [Sphingomicrobium sp.]